MSRDSSPIMDILLRFDGMTQVIRTSPLNLGGSTGSGGGSGGGPGGRIGQLVQTAVAGDTTESYTPTSGSIRHLLDNLDRIREWTHPAHNFFATTGSPPVNRLCISSGSWYFNNRQAPLRFVGSESVPNTPTISPPSSGSRFDLLIINSTGTLGWVHGTENASPTLPLFPNMSSGSIPLWVVLARSSGSCITKYDDGINHYIFGDFRPFLWTVDVVGAETTYFMWNTASDVATYKKLLSSVPSGSTQYTTVAVSSGSTPIQSWITEPSTPNATFINDGTWHFHFHANRTAGTKDVSIFPQIFKRSSGGTETLLFTCDPTPSVPDTETEFDIETAHPEVSIDATDRIVVKLFANPLGGGSTPSVRVGYDGGTASRVELPLSQSGGGTSGSAPGAWMDNAGDVMNFAPTNVLTVGANGKYTTIQAAVNAASSGQTIIISPGTYAGASIAKDLSICSLGHNRGAVVLSSGIAASGGANVYVENLTVEHQSGSGTSIDANAASIYAKNVIVRASGGSPVYGFVAKNNGVIYAEECSVFQSGAAFQTGFQCGDSDSALMFLWGCSSHASIAAQTGGGTLRISSGSYSGSTVDLKNLSGVLSVSGARYLTTSGSINFIDVPNNIRIVGSAHAHYSTITSALSDSAGFASASNPVKIQVSPGTYAESFTIGDYQEVVGEGERTTIINGTVTLNGTRASISKCRINPASGTGVVVSGGSPYIFDNAIVASSGSAFQVTAGTPTFRANSFTGSTGAVMSGGNALLTDNFHNETFNLLVNGATVYIDDAMDTFTMTGGLVTFGAKSSVDDSVTTPGGTAGGVLVKRATGEIYLSIPMAARVRHSSNQAITNNTLTALAFNTEDFDLAAFHDTSTNNSRLTIPTGRTGYYQIIGSAEFEASGTGNRELYIRKNGTDYFSGVSQAGLAGGTDCSMTISAIASLSAGDYVELVVRQGSGGDLNVRVDGSLSPVFMISRLV